MFMNCFSLFETLTKSQTLNHIADELGIHVGTVRRWVEKREVPKQYYFDLCRMSGIEVDYSQFSVVEKDQFFTNHDSARYCYNKALEVIKSFGDDPEKYNIIEPSAGDGAFYNLFPQDRRIGVDIEPKCDGVIESDYLEWEPENTNNIVIGNPPFGLRGNLALKFINHSAKFSDYVCFVLPQLFDSNGKGSCKSRVVGMNLVHSETISSSFYYPDGKDVTVNVVFQVWSKHHKIVEDTVDLTGIVKLYSLSDGGSPSSTRNKKMLYSCDYYIPSTCFGSDKMVAYTEFEKLPHRRGYGIVVESDNPVVRETIESIDWSDVSFPSTNGAYNIRFDLIEKAIGNNLPKDIAKPTVDILSFI